MNNAFQRYCGVAERGFYYGKNFISVTNLMHKFLYSYNVTVLYDHSQRVTIPYALYIKFEVLRMSVILLETCRGL
jgi:hypothetical protein